MPDIKGCLVTIDAMGCQRTKYLWLKKQYDLNDVETRMLKEFMEDCNYNIVKAYSLKAGSDQLWNVHPKAVEPLLEA